MNANVFVCVCGSMRLIAFNEDEYFFAKRGLRKKKEEQTIL